MGLAVSETRCGFLGSLDPNGVPNANPSGPQHLGIEREAASEAAADVEQHSRIPLERVGIDGRHRTAAAQ